MVSPRLSLSSEAKASQPPGGFFSPVDRNMTAISALALLIVIVIGLLLIIEKEDSGFGAVPVPIRREE